MAENGTGTGQSLTGRKDWYATNLGAAERPFNLAAMPFQIFPDRPRADAAQTRNADMEAAPVQGQDAAQPQQTSRNGSTAEPQTERVIAETVNAGPAAPQAQDAPAPTNAATATTRNDVNGIALAAQPANPFAFQEQTRDQGRTDPDDVSAEFSPEGDIVFALPNNELARREMAEREELSRRMNVQGPIMNSVYRAKEESDEREREKTGQALYTMRESIKQSQQQYMQQVIQESMMAVESANRIIAQRQAALQQEIDALDQRYAVLQEEEAALVEKQETLKEEEVVLQEEKQALIVEGQEIEAAHVAETANNEVLAAAVEEKQEAAKVAQDEYVAAQVDTMTFEAMAANDQAKVEEQQGQTRYTADETLAAIDRVKALDDAAIKHPETGESLYRNERGQIVNVEGKRQRLEDGAIDESKLTSFEERTSANAEAWRARRHYDRSVEELQQAEQQASQTNQDLDESRGRLDEAGRRVWQTGRDLRVAEAAYEVSNKKLEEIRGWRADHEQRTSANEQNIARNANEQAETAAALDSNRAEQRENRAEYHQKTQEMEEIQRYADWVNSPETQAKIRSGEIKKEDIIKEAPESIRDELRNEIETRARQHRFERAQREAPSTEGLTRTGTSASGSDLTATTPPASTHFSAAASGANTDETTTPAPGATNTNDPNAAAPQRQQQGAALSTPAI